jgi:hypothetical protein
MHADDNNSNSANGEFISNGEIERCPLLSLDATIQKLPLFIPFLVVFILFLASTVLGTMLETVFLDYFSPFSLYPLPCI